MFASGRRPQFGHEAACDPSLLEDRMKYKRNFYFLKEGAGTQHNTHTTQHARNVQHPQRMRGAPAHKQNPKGHHKTYQTPPNHHGAEQGTYTTGAT